jgi:hypothetical protein
LASHRILYRDGKPLAWRRSQFVEMFDEHAEPTPMIQALLQGKLGLHLPQKIALPDTKPLNQQTAPQDTKPPRPRTGRLF